MRQGLRLYFRLVAASFRSFMQYKFSFTITLFFNAVVSVVDFGVVLVILYHFREMGGWNLYQVGALYGTTSTSYGLYRAFGAELHNFQEYIIKGEFDGLLLRPWPTLVILLSRRLELFRLGTILQGMGALLVSLHYLGGLGALGLNYFYILFLPLWGSTIFMAITIAVGALAFWIGRVRDIQTFAVYAPNYAGSYPLSIYPRWLQGVLTMIPVAFIGYVPLTYIFAKGGQWWYMVLPMLVSFASLFLSICLWHAGERAYHSTGS